LLLVLMLVLAVPGRGRRGQRWWRWWPGVGHRRIAVAWGYPAEVVRAWLRRFAGCFKAVHAVFTRWFRALGPNLVLFGLAGTD
jgi:hypothetical protein